MRTPCTQIHSHNLGIKTMFYCYPTLATVNVLTDINIIKKFIEFIVGSNAKIIDNSLKAVSATFKFCKQVSNI